MRLGLYNLARQLEVPTSDIEFVYTNSNHGVFMTMVDNQYMTGEFHISGYGSFWIATIVRFKHCSSFRDCLTMFKKISQLASFSAEELAV